uniref:Uncharacterized protein n=1 Tax=Avena sativa TaxID=4498 RepID=A0ACD5TAV8_AVESA
MVAGIMVTASTGAMNSLLGKLATLMGEEFAKLKNLRKEVKLMRDELSSMKDALERLADVDDLDPQTKRWRNTLRELSYDIEDIIDDFMQKIGANHRNSSFVRKTIRRVKTSIFRHQIASQIEEIKKLVHETSNRHKRYDLKKVILPSSNDVSIDPRVKTLYENTANLVGVEGPVNDLVNRLEDKENQLKVVSIVGFGGLGKTTLANVVYNKIKVEFDRCAFVPVSQKPDIPKLLRSLLHQLGSGPSSHDFELNVLLDKLRERLKNKRYLIIIDDIWDVDAWGVIKCAFPENDLCSRVIATTRIQNVAKTCCSKPCDYVLSMKPLRDEESRQLFFGRIFDSEEACPQQFKDISVEILKKCDGLPLAIISISGLLATDSSNLDEWEYVRNSLGFMHGTKLTLEGMRQILNLSYKDLPCQLKTCFLYLGMYPEDYAIERSELERQWIAEGFVSKEHGQDVEKIARSYFNELVNRSLIQPAKFDSKGSATECKVHDMMLDLILLKSAEENFLTIVDGPQAVTELDYKVHRLSLRLNDASNASMLPSNISISQVRSVMIFRDSWNVPSLSKLKFVRVLFVDSHTTVKLTGLAKLFQLRYLAIHRNIPSDIVHVPHLLHLNIGSNSKLPDGISNMKSLLSLSAFNIEINSLDNIKGLGELTSIRTLTLTSDEHYNDYRAETMRRIDVIGSALTKLSRLESLYLYHRSISMDRLFASFPPPRSLRRLETCQGDQCCWFSRVPNFTKEHHNLRELNLKVLDLHKADIGILAELPSLAILELKASNPYRDEQTVVICGRFPVLKCFGLALNRACNLTFQAGAMPMLQRLMLTFSISKDRLNMDEGSGPSGIENLPALEKVSAYIMYYQETESERRSAESALRSAVSIHPRNPCVEVYFSQRFTGI